MKKLSLPIGELGEQYEVVVVGSGYGGGIAAARCARAGKRVCVLERGKEFLPGEFPDTLEEATRELQTNALKHEPGGEMGLYDLHVNEDIHVLVGCGLGGTSLINANVVIRPDKRVFLQPEWPAGLQDDIDGALEEGFLRAQEVLSPTPYPNGRDGFPELKKLGALQTAAAALGEESYPVSIAVNFERFEGGTNPFHVKQAPCRLCGDCCSGCNYTAKNTVQMNYLPDAFNHGAEIFTEVKVSHVEAAGEQWLVHYKLPGSGSERFEGPTQFVRADVVVLGAGTLGSTEILLRSRQRGLALSPRLGHRFSGNGDFLSFAYNADEPIQAVGEGSHKLDPEELPGPCITGIIDTRDREPMEKGMSIEEGVIPGALMSRFSAFLFQKVAALQGTDTDGGIGDFLRERAREIDSLVRGPYHGAMDNTMTFLVMAHDSAAGRIELEQDRAKVIWRGAAKEPIYEEIREKLFAITKTLGGNYIPNPVWSGALGHDLITVHPLGGCPMGDDVSKGVVNHKGQVFAADGGVHKGLYVSDGAVIPTSLGTNPLWTISALSERNMAYLAQEYGWDISEAPSPPPTRATQQPKIGLQFTEAMRGYCSTQVRIEHAPQALTEAQRGKYLEAERDGKDSGHATSFVATIRAQDLDAMLQSDTHEASLTGTVTAPFLSPHALTISQGTFQLFVDSSREVDTRNMRYQMQLQTRQGEAFFLDGFKVIRDDPGFDALADTTTLYTTFYEGSDATGAIVAQGVLYVEPFDFLQQMATMQVRGTHSLGERIAGLTAFGRLFMGTLFDTYGGALSGLRYFDPDATPRKKRPLRVGAPQLYPFTTADGASLRLTRFQGGKKGPVLLSHGLGVSSRIFSTDTINTNLLEFLYAHSYDVWLLDYRASIELAASQELFCGDDIARYDYPAAVDKVLEVTQARDLQCVVHCFGSTTWTMAMLGGHLEAAKIRSAVCSQVSAHAFAPLATRLKSGLHAPSWLHAFGVDSLSAYTSEDAPWWQKLWDKALEVYPVEDEEECRNPVCHRIHFLYGMLYEHDQLNKGSHDALHEMFGVANIQSFEHLARITREEHIVGSEGEELYMPYPERMRLPVLFLSGAENQCFLPKSTARTYQWLSEHNGDGLYQRRVIPNYGHIDCIFGKNAARDVFPSILHHLDLFNG